MTNDQLKILFDESDLALSEYQLHQLKKFIDLFIEKNKVINLTKINSEQEFLIKHMLDSLLADSLMDFSAVKTAADVGTGGGLPGLPLAIMHPETAFTLIDSVQKKIKCVETFAIQLGLDNVKGLSDRLEVIGQDPKYREQFDLVISRALAPLNTLLELSVPLVKTGGRFVALKAKGYLEEIHYAERAMKELGLNMPKVERYELPDDMGYRYLLIFDKTKLTKKTYPRRVGVPKKAPL